MARSRKTKSNRVNRKPRGTRATTSRRLRLPSAKRTDSLREFEDRREWHPQGPTRPVRSFSKVTEYVQDNELHRGRGRADGIRVKPYSDPARMAFRRPKEVPVCVRRKVRKEVIHANGNAGKTGQRRPRWNRNSKVRCK
jgi:hypothetical protein